MGSKNQPIKSENPPPPAGPVMLYDGVCALCNQVVQTILRHDRKNTLRFAALQSQFAAGVRARHPVLEGVDSVVVIRPATGSGPERVFLRSAAALEIAAYLGGFWIIFLPGWLIPTRLRDWLYDFIAKNRYRWFGKHDTCWLPQPEWRARFIEDE